MKRRFLRKLLSLFLVIAFLIQTFSYSAYGQLGPINAPFLNFNPATLRYLSVNSSNPFNYFNFLLDKGDSRLATTQLNTQVKQLINYFFLGITLPDNAFWVNLRPDEPGRITSEELALTDMGKVLLEQDLQLKRDMARYLHPSNTKGKEFWEKLYATIGKDKVKKAEITTSNRVWIVPDEAVVMETEDGAFVASAKLKVLLESEYLQMKNKGLFANKEAFSETQKQNIQTISENLMKEIILPTITRDVNASQTYAPLRQIYNSLILAQWFKRKHRNSQSLYAKAIDQSKLEGLESEFPWSKQQIWLDYLESYKNGEYKLKDKLVGLNRMYFSGGMVFGKEEFNTAFKVEGQLFDSAASPLIKGNIPQAPESLNPIITETPQSEETITNNRGGIWLTKITAFILGITATGILSSAQPATGADKEQFKKPSISTQESFKNPFEEVAKILNVPLRIESPEYGYLYLGGLAKYKGKIRPIYWRSRSGPYYLDTGDKLIYIGEEFKGNYPDGWEGNIGHEAALKYLKDNPPQKPTENKPPSKSSVSVAQKTMTYEEIDKKIDEIPRSARPYIGFGLGRDKNGKPVLVVQQYLDKELTKKRSGEVEHFEVSDVVNFFAHEGKIYIKALGKTMGSFEYIVINHDDYSLWDDKSIPPHIKTFIDSGGRISHHPEITITIDESKIKEFYEDVKKLRDKAYKDKNPSLFDEAVKRYKESGWSWHSLIRRGIISALIEKYELSRDKSHLKQALEALDYHEGMLTNEDRKDVYFNFGLIFYRLEDYESALKYFSKARDLGDWEAVEYIKKIKNLQNLHNKIDSYEKARQATELNSPRILGLEKGIHALERKIAGLNDKKEITRYQKQMEKMQALLDMAIAKESTSASSPIEKKSVQEGERQGLTPEALKKDGAPSSSAASSLYPGGIDLSQIELTLKDEKFISSLNPADLKILRAARALNQGWTSLSLLYIHEVMLLLKYNLIPDLTQRQAALQVMSQLKARQILDSEAGIFFNTLQSNQSIPELRLILK